MSILRIWLFQQLDTREGRAGNDDAGYVYSPVGYYDFTSSPYFAPTVGYYSDPRTTQPMIPPSSFNRPCSYYQRRGSKPGIYAGGTTYYYAPPPPPAPVPFGTTQFAAPANPGYIYPPTMVYGANTNDPANAMQPVSPNSSSSASPASNGKLTSSNKWLYGMFGEINGKLRPVTSKLESRPSCREWWQFCQRVQVCVMLEKSIIDIYTTSNTCRLQISKWLQTLYFADCQ